MSNQNSFTVTGILISKGSIKQITDRFRARDFAVELPDVEYPQKIGMQLSQAKCELLDKFSVGDEIKVNYNILGKKYNDKVTQEEKYFNVISAWKIEGTKYDGVVENSLKPNHDDWKPDNKYTRPIETKPEELIKPDDSGLPF